MKKNDEYREKYLRALWFIKTGSGDLFTLAIIGFVVKIIAVMQGKGINWFDTLILIVMLIATGKAIGSVSIKEFREKRREEIRNEKKEKAKN